MPTFRSIGVHPDLRLVTETVDGKQQQLVLTPQALLSRPPGSLRILTTTTTTNIDDDETNNNINNNDNNDNETNDNIIERTVALPIKLDQVQKLRNDVATELINQSKTGKRIRWIQQQQQQQDETNNNDDDRQSKRFKRKLNDNNTSSNIPGTISVLDLLRNERKQQKGKYGWYPLKTGCKQLDYVISIPVEHQKILFSKMDTINNEKNNTQQYYGIPFGTVVQISGPSGCGKTQLALTIIAQNQQCLHKVIYIYSGIPQPQRLAQLCRGGENNYNNNFLQILQRTQFCHANNEYDVLAHLSKLEESILNNNNDNNNDDNTNYNGPILLIIDSCSGCINSSTSMTDEYHDKNMMIVLNTIRRLTNSYKLATILIVGSVTDRSSNNVIDDMQLKPALGSRWNKYASDIQIWLELNGTIYLHKHPLSKVVVVVVRTSSQQQQNQPIAKFRISTTGGFQDAK